MLLGKSSVPRGGRGGLPQVQACTRVPAPGNVRYTWLPLWRISRQRPSLPMALSSQRRSSGNSPSWATSGSRYTTARKSAMVPEWCGIKYSAHVQAHFSLFMYTWLF